MKNILLTIFILLCSCWVNAQTRDKRLNLTVYAGLQEYAGDKGNGFFQTQPKAFDDNYLVGGSASYYLSKCFDIMAQGHWGVMGFVPEGWGDQRLFKNDLAVGSIDLKFKFGVADKALLKPYIFAGTGIIYYDQNMIEGREWMPFTGGAGLNLRLGKNTSLQYQITYCYGGRDYHDHTIAGSYNDSYLMNTIGFGLNLGSVKDSDGDKVPDKRDKCPGTPANVKVNKDGCPLDSDNDGVADYMDKCATVAGTVLGCPDADKDGVADMADQCPDAAGSAALNGCPDRDGDAVIDSKDKCPDLAGSVAFDGCPDTDGDGVQDALDACPDKRGLATMNGCPDRDNDGVRDELDKCPDLSGSGSQAGCPDTDNDGVFDHEDKCITIAGTAANNGCPPAPKKKAKR